MGANMIKTRTQNGYKRERYIPHKYTQVLSVRAPLSDWERRKTSLGASAQAATSKQLTLTRRQPRKQTDNTQPLIIFKWRQYNTKTISNHLTFKRTRDPFKNLESGHQHLQVTGNYCPFKQWVDTSDRCKYCKLVMSAVVILRST